MQSTLLLQTISYIHVYTPSVADMHTSLGSNLHAYKQDTVCTVNIWDTLSFPSNKYAILAGIIEFLFPHMIRASDLQHPISLTIQKDSREISIQNCRRMGY